MKGIIYITMAFLLMSIISPIIAFADSDDVSKEEKVQLEILPKLSGGSEISNGGMDLEVLSNYQPKPFAAGGFLSYSAIDKVTLTDLTGKWAGWKLTVEATPLKNEEYQFPRGSLSLMEPYRLMGISGQNTLPTLAYSDKIIVDDGQVLIASAERNSGMGSYEVEFGEGSLLLAIDENSSYEDKPESGVYHTTLNWSLVSSDGEVRVLKSEQYDIEVDTDYLYEGVKKPVVKNPDESDYHGGYNDGYNDAKEGEDNKLGSNFEKTYYNIGYNKGYNDYIEGMKNIMEEMGYDKDSYNAGYDKGYRDGLNSNYNNDGSGNESYNDGYDTGYQDGLKNRPGDKLFDKLPSTGSTIYDFMLTGIMLMIAGTSVYFIRRKESSK